MKVFLTGATGAVGRPTLPRLVAAGHRVTAVARGDAKRAEVEAAGADPVTVGLFDPDAVARAVEGHDAVVNLATNIPPMERAARPSAWATNDRLRREASAHLVDAALATGAGRFVQESITFLYEDGGRRWLAAGEAPVRAAPATASALEAEAQVARFTEAGGAGVVLRFGLFYGPGLAHTESFLRMARLGLAPTMGAPDRYVSSVHVDDAAAAVVAALEAPPGTYDVVDDEPVTARAYGDALVAAAGRRRGLHLPGRGARLLGAKVEPLTRSQRVSNRRFREATGWAPAHRSVVEGMRTVGPRPAGAGTAGSGHPPDGAGGAAAAGGRGEERGRG